MANDENLNKYITKLLIKINEKNDIIKFFKNYEDNID